MPLIVWLIITHEFTAAFVLFLLGGLSGCGQWLSCQRFGWQTELGAYLDPIADKAFLVSIYVTLGLADRLPVWLVIAVVTANMLIIETLSLCVDTVAPRSHRLSAPRSARPIPLAQLVFPSLVLAEPHLGSRLSRLWPCSSGSQAPLAVLSAAVYFWVSLERYRDALSLGLRRYPRARAVRKPPEAARVPQVSFVTLCRIEWRGGFPCSTGASDAVDKRFSGAD